MPVDVQGLLTYPTDFQNPVWPLERGKYQVTWNVQCQQGFLVLNR